MSDGLRDLGINVNGRTSGEVRTTCPWCSHTRSKSNDPCLAVNMDDLTYFCHHCNVSGCADNNKKPNNMPYKPINRTKKKNTTPYKETELDSLSQASIEFLKKRGISENVAISEGIRIAKKWMPQVGKEQNVLAFPFIKNNIRVATKYRDNKKNMTQDAGGEKCFYRFDEMKKGKNIYITEGEIDALTLVQCGFSDGVTSVPDGAPNPTANNLDNKFSYFTEEAMKIFDDAEKIYLVVDDDANGRFLRSELKRRIGVDKCLKVSYPESCKDINDVLLVCGENAVKEVIENAEHFPVDGLKTFDDYHSEISDLIEGVIGDFYKTGYKKIDDQGLLRIKRGQLNIVTGSPGSGKSEWVDDLMINTIKNYGIRWAVFSPENYPPQVYYKKLAEKYMGFGFDALTQDNHCEAIAGLSDKVKLIVDTDEEDVTIDYLFERIRTLVFRFGIKGVIIDPWNEIAHDIGAREDIYLNKVLRKIKRFIRKYDLTFWLVAHPKNPRRNQDGTYPKITAYDIAGGYAWFAKADQVFSVWRNKDDHTKPVEVDFQKIKQKTDGKLCTALFYYDYDSGKYTCNGSSLDEKPTCEDMGGVNVNGIEPDQF
jgi:twinkle protein